MEGWKRWGRLAGVAWLILGSVTFSTSMEPQRLGIALGEAGIGVALIAVPLRGVAIVGLLFSLILVVQSFGNQAWLANTALAWSTLLAAGLTFIASFAARPVPPKEPPQELI